MYDALTTRYTFACPDRGRDARARSRPSAGSSGCRARRIRPSSAVEFACACGDEHPGLVAHDELDWAPLGLGARRRFLNLMTARLEPVEAELGDLAARRIKAGEWPWSFFCYPEERPRPVFPSSFLAARAGAGGGRGRARRALPGLRRASRSTSSRAQHVDVPFHNDREVGVVEHVFGDDAVRRSRSSAPSSTPPASTPAG